MGKEKDFSTAKYTRKGKGPGVFLQEDAEATEGMKRQAKASIEEID
jgi:hypothetical protein